MLPKVRCKKSVINFSGKNRFGNFRFYEIKIDCWVFAKIFPTKMVLKVHRKKFVFDFLRKKLNFGVRTINLNRVNRFCFGFYHFSIYKNSNGDYTFEIWKKVEVRKFKVLEISFSFEKLYATLYYRKEAITVYFGKFESFKPAIYLLDGSGKDLEISEVDRIRDRVYGVCGDLLSYGDGVFDFISINNHAIKIVLDFSPKGFIFFVLDLLKKIEDVSCQEIVLLFKNSKDFKRAKSILDIYLLPVKCFHLKKLNNFKNYISSPTSFVFEDVKEITENLKTIDVFEKYEVSCNIATLRDIRENAFALRLVENEGFFIPFLKEEFENWVLQDVHLMFAVSKGGDVFYRFSLASKRGNEKFVKRCFVRLLKVRGYLLRLPNDFFIREKYGRYFCLLYTSPSPRDLSTSRMPSSA
mgnify:FL=1